MAYYTGQCTSYQNLADILVEKCQAHGWTWQDNILSKDDLFIKVDTDVNRGITLTGGTDKQANILKNATSNPVRLGMTATGNGQRQYFPALYHLFMFTDEIYLIMKFNVDKFYYLAFGKSHLIQGTAGNGLWLSANAYYYAHDSRVEELISISSHNGGAGGGWNPSSVAPFWNRNSFANGWTNSVICHGFDGVLWSEGYKSAYSTFEPIIDRLPTHHFADSPLLPYNIYLERPENKISLIAQFINARFVRIDNYEPEQIITLGHEHWIVFPFYKKNVNQRYGGGHTNHTGTFGWAIRYEG